MAVAAGQHIAIGVVAVAAVLDRMGREAAVDRLRKALIARHAPGAVVAIAAAVAGEQRDKFTRWIGGGAAAD